MQRILTLTAIAIIAAFSVNAQSSFSFVSQQHQQVKFDSANKVYFVDSEVNSASKINVQENTVSFVSTEGTAVSNTKIQLGKAELEAINSGNSFTLNGVKDSNGNTVKVGFWFIAGVLDEVSYTNETTQVTIAYKDIVSKADETAANAIALNKTNKGQKLN